MCAFFPVQTRLCYCIALQDPMFVQRLQMIQMNPSSLGGSMNDPRLMEVIGFLLGIPLNAASGAPGEDMPSQDEDVPMPTRASAPAAAAAPPPTVL
jgi:hypothetical protein